jgi:2-hydroxychromene-2-carboxylate isomerase
MTQSEVTFTEQPDGVVDARLPRLEDDAIRRIRAVVTCHAVALSATSAVLRIPRGQRQLLEELVVREQAGRTEDLIVPVYYDFNTPFGYAATVIADRLEREYRAHFDWRGFELFPPWRPFIQVANEMIKERWERNKLIPMKVGLPVADRRPMYRRTRNALAALEFAKLVGHQKAMRDALFRAAWVHDRDIEDPSILKDIAIEAGVDGLEVEAAVVSGRFDGLLDQYRQMAVAAGVFGAPSFIVGRELVWARDPYDFVVEALARLGVSRRE